jgi:hypothetical protein
MKPDTQTVANTVDGNPKPVHDSSVASSLGVAVTLILTADDASTAARLRQRFPGAQMNDGSTGERGGLLANDGPWQFRCSYPDMATARQASLAVLPHVTVRVEALLGISEVECAALARYHACGCWASGPINNSFQPGEVSIQLDHHWGRLAELERIVGQDTIHRFIDERFPRWVRLAPTRGSGLPPSG